MLIEPMTGEAFGRIDIYPLSQEKDGTGCSVALETCKEEDKKPLLLPARAGDIFFRVKMSLNFKTVFKNYNSIVFPFVNCFLQVLLLKCPAVSGPLCPENQTEYFRDFLGGVTIQINFSMLS